MDDAPDFKIKSKPKRASLTVDGVWLHFVAKRHLAFSV